MKPIYVFIDGRELEGWTQLSLNRSKEDLTGTLTLNMFFSYIPTKPIAVDAVRSRNISVYIAGNLVFYGKIDKRKAKGKPSSGSSKTSNGANVESSVNIASNISADEYTVTLTARGQTKFLVDSSHQHDTTNYMQPTTKQIVEDLVRPWNIEIEWLATDIKLDKVRLRDGSSVYEELQRVASENCYFIYETKDGKLRVTDDTSRQTGENLLLGSNILTFGAEQSEERAKSKIKVKGQLTDSKSWGKKAIVETELEIEDTWVKTSIPITIQHYGNATPEALQRRAKFEADKRSSMSKTVSLKVFHVQQSNLQPWDIGLVHYVEIPPEGIFDVMECTQLTYNATPDSITTDLTLAPAPSMTLGGGTNPGGYLSALPEEVSDLVRIGASRRATLGVTFEDGFYPGNWGGAELSLVPPPDPNASTVVSTALDTLVNGSLAPLLKLPATFRGSE